MNTRTEPGQNPDKEASFGEQLRTAREKKGWSRHFVAMHIPGSVVSETTIKALELGLNEEPRNGTRAALIKMFPELDINAKESNEIGHKYPTHSFKSLVMR